MAKKQITPQTLMESVQRDVSNFISNLAPTMANNVVHAHCMDMILSMRRLRQKLLEEPNGKQLLRTEIDQCGIHIYKLHALLDQRVLAHPPKCREHLRQAGFLQ